MTGPPSTKPRRLNPKGARLIFFFGAPVAAGLITLLTGNLSPIGVMGGIYLTPTISSFTGTKLRPGLMPAGKQVREGAADRWWTSRQRWGFYASFSVLIMISFAFLRSAVTDTWGGGDLLLSLMCLIPLFIIFRTPPRIVDGFGVRKDRRKQ